MPEGDSKGTAPEFNSIADIVVYVLNNPEIQSVPISDEILKKEHQAYNRDIGNKIHTESENSFDRKDPLEGFLIK